MCDIDGDALLAFRAQSIGQKREINVFVPARVARTLNGIELVLDQPCPPPSCTALNTAFESTERFAVPLPQSRFLQPRD